MTKTFKNLIKIENNGDFTFNEYIKIASSIFIHYHADCVTEQE